mmetsp:Transcript_61308/g.171166  ORF Transcript_61308/g.171166 Transcript_61308/m.171166 type:complete len:354 (-) Transcript_61308:161-1222(-)
MLRGGLVVHLCHGALERHQWVSREEVRHMPGNGRRDALRRELAMQLLVDLAGDVVVHLVQVLRIVGDVARHGVVPALAEGPPAARHHRRVRLAARVRRAALGGRAVVHGRGDDVPPHVGRAEAPREDRRRRRERHHDRRDHGHLVVEVARLRHVGGLERHLEAAAAHAERHAVASGVLLGGGLVPEGGHAYVHLAAPTRPDVGRERREARVHVDARVRDGCGLGGWPPGGRGRQHEVAAAHQREDRHGRRELVRLQRGEQPRAPQPHALLHLQQAAGVASVRDGGRGLHHPAAVLLVPRAAALLGVALLPLSQLRQHLVRAQRQPHRAPAGVQPAESVLHLVTVVQAVARKVR